VSGSLSVVLPVLNAEGTLAENLQHILEVLSDLGRRFEVLIVDQGSTDLTADVAHELAVTFPQLRVARRSDESSEHGGLDAHLHQATGEYVFVHQGHMPFNVNDFRRLWELCLADHDEASTADRTSPDGGLLGPGRELGGIHALCRRTR